MASFPSRFKRFLGHWGKWIGLAVLLVAVFVVGAWSGGSPSSYDYDYEAYYDDTSTGSAAPQYNEEMAVSDSSTKNLTATPSSLTSEIDSTEARIIKTANLTLNVKDTEAAMAELSIKVTEFEGYVQSSSTWVESDESVSGYMVLRVESSYFEPLLETIRSVATLVESESISGQDVTAQYIDLQSRLTTLQAEEAQYLEILKQAVTVEELLLVSDYLAGVRGEIELIEGQLNYLADQTDYSTVTVYFYEEVSIAAPTSDWQPVVVVKEAVQTLILLGQRLVEGVIWVVVLGLPALVAFLLVRAVWRRVHGKSKSHR